MASLNAARLFGLGLKQRTLVTSRTAQAAMTCAPACQPEPRSPMQFAFVRARCLIAMPLAAPTRMRCMTPSGRIANGSPFSTENSSTNPT